MMDEVNKEGKGDKKREGTSAALIEFLQNQGSGSE